MGCYISYDDRTPLNHNLTFGVPNWVRFNVPPNTWHGIPNITAHPSRNYVLTPYYPLYGTHAQGRCSIWHRPNVQNFQRSLSNSLTFPHLPGGWAPCVVKQLCKLMNTSNVASNSCNITMKHGWAMGMFHFMKLLYTEIHKTVFLVTELIALQDVDS